MADPWDQFADAPQDDFDAAVAELTRALAQGGAPATPERSLLAPIKSPNGFGYQVPTATIEDPGIGVDYSRNALAGGGRPFPASDERQVPANPLDGGWTPRFGLMPADIEAGIKSGRFVRVDHDPFAPAKPDAGPYAEGLDLATALNMHDTELRSTTRNALLGGRDMDYPLQPGEESAPNQPAARYAQGVGLTGKVLGAMGLDDSGKRAATPWAEAAENTLHGGSLTNILHGTYKSAERLFTEGYKPGAEDGSRDTAVADSLNVAGVAGTGGFAASRAVGDTGSLGTFVGRRWAEGRAQAGKTTGRDVLNMAETMEQNGMPDDFIRNAAKDMIAKGSDKSLGDFHRGADGKWRLEVSDKYMRYPRTGAPDTTVGSTVKHPALFEGLPELANTRLRRTYGDLAGYGGRFSPGHPEYGVPSTIDVGQSSPKRRLAAVHEINHDAGFQEGFARGGGPELFRDGGVFARHRLPNESAHDAYLRMAGEIDSAVTEARLDMSAKRRREVSVEETIADLQRQGGLPPGPEIVEFYRNGGQQVRRPSNDDALNTGRKPRDPHDPDELSSAFDQAREGHWDDLTQRSPLSDQFEWNEAAAGRAKKPQPPQSPAQRESDRYKAAVRDYEAELSGKSPEQIASALEKRFGFPVDRDLLAKKAEWWHLGEVVSGDLPAVAKPKPAAGQPGLVTDEVREQINALVRRGVKPADVAKSIDAYVKPEVVERVATAVAERLAKRERLGRYLFPQDRIYAAPEFDGMRTPEAAAILSERLGRAVKAEHVQQARSRAKEVGIEIPVPMGAPTKPGVPRLYFRKAAAGKYTEGKWVILDGGKEYKTGAGPKDVAAAEGALAEHVRAKKDGTLKAVGVPVSNEDSRREPSLWDRINLWGGH